MATRYKVSSSLSSRRVARIITVDPTNRKIEGQLKDGGLIQISLFDVPPFFVWPKQDEFWIVRQDGNYWKLYNKFDDNDDTKISTLNPGEAKVAAEIVRTPSGKKFATFADDDYDWTSLQLINGWQDVSTLNAGDSGWAYSKLSVDEEHLLDLPSVGYQYNPFRKSIYLRGMIYNSDCSNTEFCVLEKYKPVKSILGIGGSLVLKPSGLLAFSNSNVSGENSVTLNGISIQIDSVIDDSTYD